MKKRYTSDPKQASRRNAFTNKFNSKKILLALFAFLLIGGNVARCANWTPIQPTSDNTENVYYLTTNGSTTQFYVNGGSTAYDAIGGFNMSSGTNRNIKIVFNTSQPVTLAGRITISTNCKLTMELGSDYSSNTTLSLNAISIPDWNALITINNPSSDNTDAPSRQIIIKGKDEVINDTTATNYQTAKQFIIDGNATTVSVTTFGNSYKSNLSGRTFNGPLFRANFGTFELTNVTIKNYWNSFTKGKSAAVLFVNNDKSTYKHSVNIQMTHCYVYKCAASYPGLALQFTNSNASSTASMTLTKCRFEKCVNASTHNATIGSDAVIRSISNSMCNLSIDECTVLENYGGGVRWQSVGANPATISNCLIKNNFCPENGGGLYIMAGANITGCHVIGNRTNGKGGGIYYTFFNESKTQPTPGSTTENYKVYGFLRPRDAVLTLDASTEIKGNTAYGNGGGMAIEATRISPFQFAYYYSYNAATSSFTTDFLKLDLYLQGATIQGNTSTNGNGGGIYISRTEDAFFYGTNCYLQHGTIKQNHANGKGGGVYVNCPNTTIAPIFTHAPIYTQLGASTPTASDFIPQDINVIVSTSSEATNKMLIDENIAANGAGVYVEAYPITYNGVTSNTTTTVYDYTEISNNTASTDGGGLYVKQGNVSILQNGSAKSPTFIKNTATNGNGGGLYLQEGTITLKGATIGGSSGNGNTAGTSGGGIYTQLGNIYINPNENENTPTNISYNTANLNGGGINTHEGKVYAYGSFDGGTDHLIAITYNTATTGSGGGVFCMGISNTEQSVLLRRVNLSNNKALNGGGDAGTGVSAGCGGGLYLQQGLIRINRCTIDNNTAKLNGGGINNHEGTIDVLACNITNNEAGLNNASAGSGGGIYTHSGNIGINYWGGALQNETRQTVITGNTAKLNGGGLNTHNGKIWAYGNSSASTSRILINNNKATTGSGGAIFCMGEASGTTTTTFIEMKHVDLKCNKALDGGGSAGTGVSAGCGGGIYLQLGEIDVTDVTMQNNYAKVNGGAINNHKGFVDIYGCIIGGTGYYDGSTPDSKGNKADQSGGGIYTVEGDIDVEDYIEHSNGSANRFESKLDYNWAVENGGALNTHSGTIWVNRNQRDDETTITYNKARKGGGIYANEGTIVVYNTHIDNNTATENGGGVNNHAGDISIYGGTLNNNTATNGLGGGAFTYVGDVNILPFPSTLTTPTINDGTKVFNNLAKLNGGGINNHTGRVDIRYASLRNNTAREGNGGGIFCEGAHSNAIGYTIRLFRTELKENKTRGQDGTPQDPTGRGGGIYLKYGSIYAHESDIIDNFANVNGGGLDNHDGSILVYGCNILNNRAVTGRGGGIYTETGSITTGPSLVGGTSVASVIQGNKAYINGGGINNHQGDIFLNGDHILDNTAETGHGGGIYIANGTIDMYGGKIANNTAAQGDGGGVYSGGGQFNIQKREGKPIVEIIDIEVLSNDEAVVHYHLIDKGTGNIVYPDASPVGEHGIFWSATKADVVAATYESHSSVNQINTGHTVGDDGCYRLHITGLSDGTPYYTKAYAVNDTPLSDTSFTAAFTTYGTLPVVVSGTVANITKNSAEGSGKLLYSNSATICGVCYIQKDGNLSNLSELTVGASGVLTQQETLSSGTYPDEHFFTMNLTSLTNGKKYFARAYAKNTYGYAYGDTVSFVTLKDTPAMTGALSVTGMVSNNGKYDVSFQYTMDPTSLTAYGFVISTESNTQLLPENIFAGTPGTDMFTGTKTSLEPGTTYYVRAYASTAAEEAGPTPALDITNYSISEPLQFFTPDADGKPIVRATSLSNVTQHAADISGKIVNTGTTAITNYGIVWSQTTTTPEVGASQGAGNCYFYDLTSGIPTEDDPFTLHMPGYATTPGDQDTLKVNTTYYLRLYAKNGSGYSYSNEFTFSTLPQTIPYVIVSPIDNITKTSATVHCSATDGGATITDWGILYSTNSDMSSATNVNKPGSTFASPFTVNLTSLSAHTTYYIKAYATNSVGTHTTSNAVYFTTLYDQPSATMTSVDNITYDASATVGTRNSARANAEVEPHDATTPNNINTYGVCWSTLPNPTRMSSDYTDSHFYEMTGAGLSGNHSFNYTWTQKYPNTKYYVRAYASVNNPSGGTLDEIVYSLTQEVFITLPEMVTGTATNIGKTSATLSGQIASRDSEGYLVGGYYGVCWGTSTNPTKGADNFVEALINSSNPNTFAYTLTATSLSAGTTYYYRAYYRTASDNIAYANQAASTFTTKDYNLTVEASPAAGGTVSPTSAGMNNGDTQSVTATANPGYTFSSWSYTGGGIGAAIDDASQSTATFTMGNPGADATLTANFTANNYTLTVTADPVGGGTFTVNSVAYSAPVSVAYNSSITLVATPASGKAFVNWTLNGNEVSTDATYTFTYETVGNAEYVAHFEDDGAKSTSVGPSKGSGNSTFGKSRDIYPSFAREPWDWDEEEPTRAGEPKVNTGTLSITNANNATCTGSVTDIGTSDVTAYGICWGTTTEPTTSGNHTTVSYTQTTAFEIPAQTMSGLTGGTVYYVRAYATNTQGTSYGDVITFTTTTPLVSTGFIDITSSTSATCSGSIIAIGGSDITAYGICWGTSIDPTTLDNHTETTGPFSTAFDIPPQTMSSLTEGELYYVRAYATNSSGTAYGANLMFRTNEPIDIPIIEHNMAERGGGVYMARNDSDRAKLVFSGGSSASERGRIILNTATEAGGGIYIDTTAWMQMKGHCEVNGNHVPNGKDGGGIYLKGRLYVGNPGSTASQNGLIVNRNFAMDNFNEIDYNANPSSYTNTNINNKNNVCLTRHTYHYEHTYDHGSIVASNYDDESTVITLLSDISGKDVSGNLYSNIGFHVKHGFCPVIATSDGFGNAYKITYQAYGDPLVPALDPEYETWLSNLMAAGNLGGTLSANSAIFEDTESYIALHTISPQDPFHSKYIYLWGCWTHPAVMDDPETNNPMVGTGSGWLHHYIITNPSDNTNANTNPLHWEIYSAEGLAWFTSYVNGLNAFKNGDAGVHMQYYADKNPYATATLMNDIDMSAYYWVPIGSVTQYNGATTTNITTGSIFTDDNNHHFKGTIDGQGHTIKGIKCQNISGIFENGLVGYLDGGTVKNVFIDEAILVANNHATRGYHIGGVAGSMQGNATISACEARASIDVSNAISNKSLSYVGGLVGKVDGTCTIHSSMAMPEITGAVDYMGGLVGQLGAGNSLLNSFANAKFPAASYNMNDGKYIGGLVGDNNGIVENCYSRLQGNEPENSTHVNVFGWLAGSNRVAASGSGEGGIRFSYIPSGQTVYVKNTTSGYNEAPYGHGTYSATTLVNGKYGFKHRDQAVTASNNSYINNDTLTGGLQHALNAWVTTKGSTIYHPWMRTMASTINDDLPILNFKKEGAKALSTDPAYNAVGAKDGVYIDYANNANDLLTEYVALDPATYPSPSVYLYDANTLADGTTAEPIRVTNIGTTNPNVTFEINEDVGITVADAALATGLKARVGVTLDNSSGNDLGGKNYDWHMFSSAINGVPMGITYNSNGTAPYAGGTYQIKNNYSTLVSTGITDSDYGNRTYMDPPLIIWNTAPGTTGYFPTNTPYGTWGSSHSPTSGENPDPDFYQGSFDFYCYGEKHYQHWINFKREGVASFYDHWRQDPTEDGYHLNIPYMNETNMINGKGYMVAMSKLSMLMADGTLNNGDVSYTATYTVDPSATVYDEMVRGTNLIGNPYQSYLDFDKFAKSDGGWTSPNNGKILNDAYYILDADKTGYIAHPNDGSSNPEYAPRYIHPHQGFFVRVSSQQNLKFTEGMRVPGNWKNGGALEYSDFREDKLNYPLVNLMCYDNSGKRDLTTVEINRPEINGALKMKGLRTSNGLLYARFENNDYQALFAPEGVTEVPVRFEPLEDDVFTIKWSTYNGDFHYLHLIDNLAGADVDMLTAQEYKFEGRTTDYVSRFKLVFEVTDVDEHADDDPGSKTFAFQMGDELIVNGAGILQMFDVTGRCLLSTQTASAQSSVSLPKVAAGVYMLRLTGNQQNKVQKIIIK